MTPGIEGLRFLTSSLESECALIFSGSGKGPVASPAVAALSFLSCLRQQEASVGFIIDNCEEILSREPGHPTEDTHLSGPLFSLSEKWIGQFLFLLSTKIKGH